MSVGLPLPLTEPDTRANALSVVIERLYFNTTGDAHIVNITPEVRHAVEATGISNGIVTVFVPGATGGLTTLEFEPGVVRDFQNLFDLVASPAARYEHNQTHPDENGHAHVRAGLLGPSLVVPIENGQLTLGRWQEICFVCFDNRPRERTVVLQMLGVK